MNRRTRRDEHRLGGATYCVPSRGIVLFTRYSAHCFIKLYCDEVNALPDIINNLLTYFPNRVPSPEARACASAMISMFPDSALSFQLKYPVGKSSYSRSTPWFSKKLGEVLVDGNDIPDLGFSGAETLGGKVHRAVPMSCAANGRF